MLESVAVLRPGLPHRDAARGDRARRARRTPTSPACSATSAPAPAGSSSRRSTASWQMVEVGHQHLPAADPDAGAQPAPGARRLRAVPLAGQVRRRQARGAHALRRRRSEHARPRRCSCCTSAARRARSNSGIHWHVGPGVRIRYLSDHPAARRSTRSSSRTPTAAQRASRTQAVAARRCAVAHHGLHRLPQPAPHIFRTPAPGDRRRARRWPDRHLAALRQARGPACAAGAIRVAGAGAQRHQPAISTAFYRDQLSRPGRGQRASAVTAGGQGARRHLV